MLRAVGGTTDGGHGCTCVQIEFGGDRRVCLAAIGAAGWALQRLRRWCVGCHAEGVGRVSHHMAPELVTMLPMLSSLNCPSRV